MTDDGRQQTQTTEGRCQRPDIGRQTTDGRLLNTVGRVMSERIESFRDLKVYKVVFELQ